MPKECAKGKGPLDKSSDRDEDHQGLCLFSDEGDRDLIFLCKAMEAITLTPSL